MLSKADQGEVSKKQYVDFEWDQETFDLRILRSHEKCSATSEALSETEVLTTVLLASRMHNRTMSCVVPMTKADGSWKATRHWAPMEKLNAAIVSARKELTSQLDGKAELDAEAWGSSASAAYAAYWASIEAPMNEVRKLAGGEIPTFCHGPLNLDGGKDLAFAYLSFQERDETNKKPKHVVENTLLHQNLIDGIRGGYKPLVTLVHDGVRLDLVTAKPGDDSDGNVTKDEVRTMMVMYGELKSPLYWTLYVYSKGVETNTGKGEPIDILTDVPNFVPDAPDLSMAVFEFPKMPPGTDKLELELVDASEKHEFHVPIPVLPEFLSQQG